MSKIKEMKKTLLIAIVIIIFFISLILFPKKQEEAEEIKVIATLFPYYDMAKEIGGEKISVSLLLPPGAEVHSFEPKTSDFIKINNADIFIYTGDFMEPWAKRIMESISNKEIIVIRASDGIKLLEDEDEHEDKDDNKYDPHIWLDIENSKKIADEITKALIAVSLKNEMFFIERSNNYINKLQKLDNDFAKSLEKCKNGEIIYSGHYAFAYLAEKYNLKHSAILGISHDTEPTISSLLSVIEKIKNEGISHIFYEELSDPKIAKIIKEETKAEMLPLNPAENLSKEDFEKGVSFIKIMEENLENLKNGLRCK